MVDMEGLRRRLAKLEDYAEKCYLDHGNPDPGKEAEQSCPHDDFMSCVGGILQEIRAVRAVCFGDVKAFPGESIRRERQIVVKNENVDLKVERSFPHYHKPCPFPSVDFYRVALLFNVTDPCIQHAIKKLLVPGGRGSKGIDKDVAEAIASLQRWQEMRFEEEQHAPSSSGWSFGDKIVAGSIEPDGRL